MKGDFKMKRIVSLALAFAIIALMGVSTPALQTTDGETLSYGYENPDGLEVSAASAMLIEAKTGTVLYTKNQDEKRSPASVTKIMTLLLVCEAIEDGRISTDDTVTISQYAASMGGSQVFLEEGECFTVEELLKCTVIASANDAAVALAEKVAGSEGNFVAEMNSRAKALGMKNTTFENVTGLDDTTVNHLTTAEDIAIMSMELLKYEIITRYSSLWQDSIRDGEFTLTNTNRLVRFYEGCNGLKTGSTEKAGYCVSASAKRDGMELIAVIMGADTRDVRNAEARALLDYGFANYALYEKAEATLEKIRVKFGTRDAADIKRVGFCKVVKRSDIKGIEEFFDIPSTAAAPMQKGDSVGKITYKIGGIEIGASDIVISEDIERLSFFDLLLRIIKNTVK